MKILFSLDLEDCLPNHFCLFLSRSGLSHYHTMTPPATDIYEPRKKTLDSSLLSRTRGADEKLSCKTYDVVIAQRNGLTNLCNHIRTHHRHIIEQKLEARRMRPRKVFEAMTVDREVCSVYSCTECVVMALQPFSFIENPIFQKHLWWKNMLRNTLLCRCRVSRRFLKRR